MKDPAKMQEFPANANLETKDEVNAKKITLKREDALALVKKVGEVYATTGNTWRAPESGHDSPSALHGPASGEDNGC